MTLTWCVTSCRGVRSSITDCSYFGSVVCVGTRVDAPVVGQMGFPGYHHPIFRYGSAAEIIVDGEVGVSYVQDRENPALSAT